VVIANVFDVQKVREKGAMLNTAQLIEDIAARKPAFALTGADDIVKHLAPELRDQDVVAIMSNGGFGGIHDKLLDTLRQKAKSSRQ
jgi:UDP-N-acetylmuramate: L-alanyl-gamma-D-glutamyl-meso-diaminopimelate ligase